MNLPLIIGIPVFVELGLLDYKPNAKTIYAVLHLADFFLCFNSFVIYSTIQKLVQGITYLPEEHKILIKQWSGRFLNLKDITYDPKDLVKSRLMSFNPFVGYRSVQNISERLGTESIGNWLDRKLLDSMIYRDNKRKVRVNRPNVTEENKE